jgi:hypothetical protein
MIYTTYFAKLNKLPENVVPIAICKWIPEVLRLSCYHYPELAPSPDFFHEYKRTGDTEYFTKCYNEQVLAKLDPHYIVDALTAWVGGKDIAFVCYEKPTDFCHRHLVANWLRAAGYTCQEYEY